MVVCYNNNMDKKVQTGLWLTPKTYEWLRETAFKTRISQSKIVEGLLQKEKEKHERRNNNN